jgi:hypothetical protein
MTNEIVFGYLKGVYSTIIYRVSKHKNAPEQQTNLE